MEELNKTNLNKIRTSINKIIRYNKDFLLKSHTSPLITNNKICTSSLVIEFSDNIINKIPLNIPESFTSIPCDENKFMKLSHKIHQRFEKESLCPKELSVKDFFSSIDKDNSSIIINMGSDNGKVFVTTDENNSDNFCFNSKLLIPILTIFKALGDERISVTRLVTNKNVLKFSTDNATIYASIFLKPEVY